MKRKRTNQSLDQAFDELIRREESLMESTKPADNFTSQQGCFIEDTFELESEEADEDYLDKYSQKFGTLSKLLSVIIFILTAIIVYQIVSIASIYFGFPFF